MSIQIGNPQPPHSANPELLIVSLIIGSVFIFGATVLVDMLGTAMFKRGFAKPFYLKGRRIHHNCIYLIVPLAYGILAGLFLLGYVQLIHGAIWTRVGYVVVLTVACITVDFVGDKFWPEIRKNVILHHEWIYSVIPIYIFTNIINIVI